jgi:hypothetical protein
MVKMMTVMSGLQILQRQLEIGANPASTPWTLTQRCTSFVISHLIIETRHKHNTSEIGCDKAHEIKKYA